MYGAVPIEVHGTARPAAKKQFAHIGKDTYEAEELAPELTSLAGAKPFRQTPDVKNFSYAVVDGDVYFREKASLMRRARPDCDSKTTVQDQGHGGASCIVQRADRLSA